VDAVVVTAPTNLHTNVMLAAAHAGKHIFTEKILALTLEECKEIQKAVAAASVRFCISFPHRTMPHNLFAKRVVDEHLIGDITLMRCRNAHGGAVANWLPEHFYDPATCGGGAMIDLGAHPMYLARWLLGRPVRITSMFSGFTGRAVEDNAVCVVEFERQALAILETGFVTPDSPFALELYGTEGTLLVGGPDKSVKLISKNQGAAVPGWILPAALPKPLAMPIFDWVRSIRDGCEPLFGIEEAMQLTELMEGAYLSFREKRQVEFAGPAQ
jgi:1,5-anhydro-D-fructose reductase (1,5-anhydro-D-mannitol-forming)